MKVRKSNNRKVTPTILISQANEISNELNGFDDLKERNNNTSLLAKDLNIGLEVRDRKRLKLLSCNCVKARSAIVENYYL